MNELNILYWPNMSKDWDTSSNDLNCPLPNTVRTLYITLTAIQISIHSNYIYSTCTRDTEIKYLFKMSVILCVSISMKLWITSLRYLQLYVITILKKKNMSHHFTVKVLCEHAFFLVCFCILFFCFFSMQEVF